MPTNVKIKGINTLFRGFSAQDPKGGETWDSTYDWAGWQKPNIDLAVSLGANTVKTYAPINQVLAGGAKETLGLQRLSNWCAYVQSKGLLIYMTGASLDQLTTTPTIPQLATALGKICAVLDMFPSVIGVDLINEINGTGWGVDFYDGLNNLMTATAQAARANTSLPITWSSGAANNGGWADIRAEQASALGDFLDIHPYYSVGDPTIADLAFLRSSGYRKPILIGECGQAGGNNPASFAAVRSSRMRALGALSAEPDCMGAVAFCLADYLGDGGVSYGFTDNALTTPARADYTAPFAAWPDRT